MSDASWRADSSASRGPASVVEGLLKLVIEGAASRPRIERRGARGSSLPPEVFPAPAIPSGGTVAATAGGDGALTARLVGARAGVDPRGDHCRRETAEDQQEEH